LGVIGGRDRYIGDRGGGLLADGAPVEAESGGDLDLGRGARAYLDVGCASSRVNRLVDVNAGGDHRDSIEGVLA